MAVVPYWHTQINAQEGTCVSASVSRRKASGSLSTMAIRAGRRLLISTFSVLHTGVLFALRYALCSNLYGRPCHCAYP